MNFQSQGMTQLPPEAGMDSEMGMDEGMHMGGEEMGQSPETVVMRDGKMYCGNCGCNLFGKGTGEHEGDDGMEG